METLRQVDLARELGVSDMTIYRLRKATFIHGTTITDRHAVMIFTAFEMQRVGVNAERSCELASRFHSEILYASGGQDRRVWLTFVDDDKHDIVLAAITARQLEAHLATFPLSVTLALHECVQRAVERLSVMRARLAGGPQHEQAGDIHQSRTCQWYRRPRRQNRASHFCNQHARQAVLLG